ncbi:MAG: MFS transporter [Firmicutes bacterium]|nr:MFS transporter [Bacillota bacterium]
MERLWTRNFVLLSLANLALFSGFTMLLPTMPLYVKALGGTESVMGLVVGIFTFTATGIRPFAGWFADTLGRKVVFLFGILVFIVATLAYRWAPTVGFLLAMRILHGIGWGCSSTASGTIAADVIPKERFGEGMGYFGLSSTVAMSMSPVLGLVIINRFGFPFFFYTSASLAIISFLLGISIGGYNGGWRTGSLASGNDAVASPGGGDQVRKFSGKALFERKAIPSALVILLSNTTFGAIVTFITLYAGEKGIPNIGSFFTVLAAAMFVIRPLSGILIDRYGDDPIVFTSLASMGIALFILFRAEVLWNFLAAAGVFGLGFGAMFVVMQALAVRGLPVHRRGAATGTFFMGFDIGIGSGAILWGIIARAVGYSQMYLMGLIPIALAICAYLAVGRVGRGPADPSPDQGQRPAHD